MSLLTRWDPINQLWREMSRVQGDVGRLFDRWGVTERGRPVFAVAYPPLNLWEDDDNVFAEAELAGMKLEDLQIFVTGTDQLTLQGKRDSVLAEKAVWHRQERGFGTFDRTVALPCPVNADLVEARLENGVLTIKMPKAEIAKPRRIPVKAE